MNDFHHMGKSQICTGADHYFSPSKPHSGKLWTVTVTAEMTVVADLGSPDNGASEAEQHGGEVDSDGVEVEVLGHLYSTVQSTEQYSTVQ